MNPANGDKVSSNELCNRARTVITAIRGLGVAELKIEQLLRVSAGDLDSANFEASEKLVRDAEHLLLAARTQVKVQVLMALGYSEREIANEAGVQPAAITRLFSEWACSDHLANQVEAVQPKLVGRRLELATRLGGIPTWSEHRAKHKTDEKEAMAETWAKQDFLVSGDNADRRDAPSTNILTVASILVNQGTTPRAAVAAALKWIRENQSRGPFDLTWYVSGTLVADTLRRFKENHPYLSSATRLFLFPGMVNLETEAVSGPAAVQFAETLERRFTYALLSAYAFDLNDGTACFYLDDEVSLQKACATRYAEHKFLFLDSTKFKREGTGGYRLEDLMVSAQTVTVYTVTSPKDEVVKAKFLALCRRLLNDQSRETSGPVAEKKSLRLRIVNAKEGDVSHTGVLVPPPQLLRLP